MHKPIGHGRYNASVRLCMHTTFLAHTALACNCLDIRRGVLLRIRFVGMTHGEYLFIECIQHFLVFPLFVTDSFVNIREHAHKMKLNNPFHQLGPKKTQQMYSHRKHCSYSIECLPHTRHHVNNCK